MFETSCRNYLPQHKKSVPQVKFLRNSHATSSTWFAVCVSVSPFFISCNWNVEMPCRNHKKVEQLYITQHYNTAFENEEQHMIFSRSTFPELWFGQNIMW